jgi:DNA-binding CsgD family transcriptional regulator
VRSWGLTAQEQDEVWARWRQGESLRLIARRLGKRSPSVRAFVLQTGGVQQHPPRRPTRCLGMAEREEISRGVAAGESYRQIAARLERAPSTVSRELASNGGRHRYRAQAADAAAFRRARRPKPAKLLLQPRLRAVVEAKLALRWSPQQIAGWLPLAYPSDPVLRCRTRPSTCRCSSRAGGRCVVSCSAVCARAGDALLASQAPAPGPRPAPRRGADQRAPRGGRGSGGAWPLGRRPAAGQAAIGGGDTRRARQPLPHPGRAARRVQS